MNYIVIDFEFNCAFSKNPKNPFTQEVIEIGAIKLDSNFSMINKFVSFVRPMVFTKLHPQIAKITYITQNQLNCADNFKIVISRFRRWVGTDFIICVWGNFDIHALIDNCLYHNVDIDWIPKYFDIQKYYSNKYRQILSLDFMLNLLCIKKTGETHKALYDAVNTAKILQTINPIEICQNLDSHRKFPKEKVKDYGDPRIRKNNIFTKCPQCGKFTKRIKYWKYYHGVLNCKCYCVNCDIVVWFYAEITELFNGQIIQNMQYKVFDRF